MKILSPTDSLPEQLSTDHVAFNLSSANQLQRYATSNLLTATAQSHAAEYRARFDMHVAQPDAMHLGQTAQTHNIASSLAPFQYLPEYHVEYPTTVSAALGELYVEYNQAFERFVAANREHETDYQFCRDANGALVNYFVQIDMVGLPHNFLGEMANCPVDIAKEILRERIFEMENSIAMYQLLSGVFAGPEQQSSFDLRFRESLNALRSRFGKPIALLAITDDKYSSMRAIEFGKQQHDMLTDGEVQQLSGFDTFLGPDAFRQHIDARNGESDYLLYVRSSDPVSKLRDPRTTVSGSLLQDARLRRIIKAHSLTLNIDDPQSAYGNKINDTKEYMPSMGMGHRIDAITDLYTTELLNHLGRGRPFADFPGEQLHPAFREYVRSKGLDPSGDVLLRAKPMKGAYGCYGHISGPPNNAEFRQKLRKNLESRGAYIVQPERHIPVMQNQTTGDEYCYIDRNLMSFTGSQPTFLAGFRSLVPLASKESASGRNHGSKETVMAEIQGV